MSSSRERGSDRPWYADGLRFECRPDCGACCTTHGEHAFVYLDDADRAAIAAHLGLEPDAFDERYTTLDDGRSVLRMDQPDCPFLADRRCAIYPVRPAQCRTFPFWEENLTSPRHWRSLASFCPGVDAGPVHPLRVIRAHVAEREGS